MPLKNTNDARSGGFLEPLYAEFDNFKDVLKQNVQKDLQMEAKHRREEVAETLKQQLNESDYS